MNSSAATGQSLGVPHLPAAPATTVDDESLAATRDVLTSAATDPDIEKALLSILDRWRINPAGIDPLPEIQDVIEAVRALPRGDVRVCAMTTIVRTLGLAANLATVLDILRESAERSGTPGQMLALDSQRATQHCIYGWAAQTLLIKSKDEPFPATVVPEDGVREMLGEAPPAVWGLSMHIWQPNPLAAGFPSAKPPEPDLVMEPPHSHPFDFTSMVAVGGMHQSIYAQLTPQLDEQVRVPGRYDGVPLEHVDGVWPPHGHRGTCEVATVEPHVWLAAGDSYFMPFGRIHDVEINVATARSTPAITLFLASEAAVKPHVYMAASMADFHAANPELKREGKALSVVSWQAKLRSAAAYLRGESPELNLDDIVNYDGRYAFFHA